MSSQGTPTLMVVDDEPFVTRSLERTFRTRGYDVLTAHGGAEALRILKATDKTVRLIIADQRMPEMTGDVFLEKSRAFFPFAVRFLLTAHADMEVLAKAVNRGGIHRYIPKPWDSGDLLETVKKSLEQQRLLLTGQAALCSRGEDIGKFRDFNRRLETSVLAGNDGFHLSLDD